MPRGKRRTHPFDTEAKRRALRPRREPYWSPLVDPKHAYLGIYIPSGDAPPTWRLRVRVARRYASEVLGDEPAIDFAAALDRARVRARQLLAAGGRRAEAADDAPAASGGYRYESRKPSGYTVGDLLADHATALRVEGKLGSARDVERAAVGPLFAALAGRPLLSIAAGDLVAWRDRLAASAAVRRSLDGAKLVRLPADADPETRRKRRARVNRLSTDLRAALNRLNRRVPWVPAETLRAFSSVEKFRDVGRGKVRPLDADEVARLLDACSTPEFRDLVRAALLTGARVAELARLRVGDFRRQDAKVHFAVTKDERERGRDVALSPEGVDLFARLAAGRPADATLLLRPSGEPWTKSTHVRPMRLAVATARLSAFPSTPTFHNLRDTYATALLRSGVRLEIVSELLGHSSVELTRRHYAIFAESDLDDAARSLPRFERPSAAVRPIAAKRKRVRA